MVIVILIFSRNDPHDYVNVHLMFRGLATPGMDTLVLDIIKQNAKKIMVNLKEYRMIGTLLIEPVSASLDVFNGTINLGPSPTSIIQPTQTVPPGRKLYNNNNNNQFFIYRALHS